MWNFKDMHLTEPPETCFKRPPGNSTECYHTFNEGEAVELSGDTAGGLECRRTLTGACSPFDRAMTLLEVLSEEDRGQRLTDLARRTGLSLTTVHRLLTTLEQRHFVQFSLGDNLWHVGRQTYMVGSAFVRDRHFVAPALPFLRRLRDLTRETANLGVVDNGEIILVNQIESREITRAISRIGGRTPMTASGMGKAVLSCYSRGGFRGRGAQRYA